MPVRLTLPPPHITLVSRVELRVIVERGGWLRQQNCVMYAPFMPFKRSALPTRVRTRTGSGAPKG